LLDEPAHSAEGLPAPVTELGDPLRDEFRCRLALARARLLHALILLREVPGPCLSDRESKHTRGPGSFRHRGPLWRPAGPPLRSNLSGSRAREIGSTVATNDREIALVVVVRLDQVQVQR